MKSTILKSIIIIGLAMTIASCSQKTSAARVKASKVMKQDRPPHQERKGHPQFAQLLEHMDTNQDGKLAKNEVRGPLENDFEMLDKDKDGFLSESEFQAAPKRPRPAR